MNLIASDAPNVGKFCDPAVTADGSPRARVALQALRTVWINTGTLCNLTCSDCYIESSPANDRLSYISRAEVRAYLDEIATQRLPVREVGFTGGEPFMNPDLPGMLEDCLRAGLQVLVLTNAMKPMMKQRRALVALQARYGHALTLRVSIDHFDPALHEQERGPRSWAPMVQGVRWLAAQGFRVHLAGRTRWGEDEATLRRGFARLCEQLGLPLDASNPAELLLFPELDEHAPVPEISSACWDLLGVQPTAMMCASSRMVVKHRGADTPTVVACTLLPYARGFSFGERLADSLGEVALNHPHCARFCVLGGGSCSG